MKVYAVKDVVSATTAVIFTAANDDLAKRKVESYICAPYANDINTFVNDKQLFEVGDLNGESMILTPISPRFVCSITEIRDKVLSELCQNEDFVKAQLGAIKKQKEVLHNAPIKRHTKREDA